MRMPLLALLAFSCSTVLAAPVKPDPKAERVKLELFWNDLHSYDPIVRVRAVLALVDHPQAAAFLDEKVRPLKVSKDQIEQWMKELNSDDEKVRNRAREELKYYDPRLHLSVDEQIALATTHFARTSLVFFWRGWELGPLRSGETSSLTIQSNQNDGIYLQFRTEIKTPRETGSSSSGFPVDTIRQHESQGWNATALAAIVLDRIGSRSAVGSLEKLANGHPEALPTRTAIALLQPGPAVPVTAKRFETSWKRLAEGSPLAVARTAIALSDDPSSAKLMKAKLPAIQAEKVQMKKWLADLGNEKDEVWRPAFESLKYFRPSLALTPEEQIAEMKDDRSRSMLFWVYNTWGETPKTLDIYPDAVLRTADLVDMSMEHSQNGGRITSPCRVGTLESMTPLEWQRARLAILALERSGTADSLVVLNQLADGHPDILPTKEAKAAEKRLGK